MQDSNSCQVIKCDHSNRILNQHTTENYLNLLHTAQMLFKSGA